MRCLVAVSTPGFTSHSPARRSVPNQATTSATLSRLGQAACRSSSEASMSEMVCATWRFSGAYCPAPSPARRSRSRSRTRWCPGSASPRAPWSRAARPGASPRTTTAECGCRISPAAGARTRHRRARDRPAPRLPWRRSADRRPGPRAPVWTRMVMLEVSSSLPSAQMRPTRPIGPSHRPTAKLAK